MIEVYMPPIDGASYIAKHHQAYREIVELGNCSITTDDTKLTYVVSERESWGDLPKLPNIPRYLCDKSLSKYYFAEVGMPTLETYLFNDVRLLKKFANIPCILKPTLSAGSTSKTEATYTLFANAHDLITQHNNIGVWLDIAKSGGIIIQRSVAYPDTPYGQLHMECVINGQGEVYFSSHHEIEFVNGMWQNS